MTPTLQGKTCLVTGATSGIGERAAAALAFHGAQVIIHGRNRLKAEVAARRIQDETGNKAVHPAFADFEHFQAVRDLALSIRENFPKLDVLINNAGAFYNTRRPTPYGVEKTLLVNHLSPYLLTTLLLEHIQESTPARIINVSSEGHRQGTMDFDDLGFQKGYFGMKAYGRSKLANILFTYELNRRAGSKALTVNAVHPGHVATNIWKTDFSIFGPALKRVMGFFALTPQQGADSLIYLATSDEVDGLTGKYSVERKFVSSSPLSYDKEVARRLWQVSEEITSESTSKD
jgi:NAD(P)-dependent dehydrogenase (short-subunit alcohol dehydrogenase family)